MEVKCQNNLNFYTFKYLKLEKVIWSSSFSSFYKENLSARVYKTLLTSCPCIYHSKPIRQNSSLRLSISFLCYVLIRRQSRLLHPPKPHYCEFVRNPNAHASSHITPSSSLLLGVCRRLCLARLLNRSGFRFVTFFAVLVHSRFVVLRRP